MQETLGTTFLNLPGHRSITSRVLVERGCTAGAIELRDHAP
jgi:hypothetical protein